MLQRLNSWGRKTFIGLTVLFAAAMSLIDSPYVPGKVMQLTGFDLSGLAGPGE